MSKSLGRWKSQMIRAAKRFPDYNFRTYFTNHIKDDLIELQKLPLPDQRKYVQTEGKKRLLEMNRMAAINMLYSSQPVFFDRKE